jgi:hypothetical protein
VSIREVLITLSEAMVLVFLVVFIFLQNWRATLIPIIAVPVSLIGTSPGCSAGLFINTLTLFGMVLAIGIVVDDAIVVLENVERIMHEEHVPARDAAVQAMTEVTSPIIAIVLCCAPCSCRSPSSEASRASCTGSSRSPSRSRWSFPDRRADAHARAVRADPQARAQGRQPSYSTIQYRVCLVSHTTPRRGLDDSPRRRGVDAVLG